MPVGRPSTSPARSSCGAVDAAPAPDADQAAAAAAGGGAAGQLVGRAAGEALALDRATGEQLVGGRSGSSMVECFLHRSPMAAARPSRAADSGPAAGPTGRPAAGRPDVVVVRVHATGRRPVAAAAATPAAPAPAAAADASARACAASRRAHSWNVGQTGNALDRQYASWWASARGAGGDSAKQRCRWSGLVARESRSSPNATNGQAGAPSMLGSPRSVIRAMIPGRTGHLRPNDPLRSADYVPR